MTPIHDWNEGASNREVVPHYVLRDEIDAVIGKGLGLQAEQREARLRGQDDIPEALSWNLASEIASVLKRHYDIRARSADEFYAIRIAEREEREKQQ